MCRDSLALNYKIDILWLTIVFLGHLISSKGIEIDKAKIDILCSVPPPTTMKEFHSLHDPVDFYKRFIKEFSKIEDQCAHC